MTKKPKVTVLWSCLSGYFNICLQQLSENVDSLIVVKRDVNQQEAPFAEDQFSWLSEQYSYETQFSQAIVAIQAQEPDILLVSGWYNRDYRSLCKAFKKTNTLVIGTCDNPWRGTLRQYAAGVMSSFLVRRYFDRIWVPGSHSEKFVRYLGFRPEEIMTGLYTCGTSIFEDVYLQRQMKAQFSPAFLFVGRYVEQKGLITLLDAYRKYRANTDKIPWELWLIGSGPLNDIITSIEGVRNWGFTQPDQLPEIFSQVGAFILPSDREAWGVVIHEAATSGLPIICTNTCGSAPELVHNEENGYVIPPKNPTALAIVMSAIANSSSERLNTMSAQSNCLSQAYSPQKWVETLMDAYKSHLDTLRI
jgi:glycosyltransferase involved in cell wall biosynthesis